MQELEVRPIVDVVFQIVEDGKEGADNPRNHEDSFLLLHDLYHLMQPRALLCQSFVKVCFTFELLEEFVLELKETLDFFLLTDAFCLGQELLLDVFSDAIAEGQLREVQLGETAVYIRLYSDSLGLEELISQVVLFVEHLHLLSVWLILQRLHAV